MKLTATIETETTDETIEKPIELADADDPRHIFDGTAARVASGVWLPGGDGGGPPQWALDELDAGGHLDPVEKNGETLSGLVGSLASLSDEERPQTLFATFTRERTEREMRQGYSTPIGRIIEASADSDD
jgi:hypothetical protein